jgi:hypothetical protein
MKSKTLISMVVVTAVIVVGAVVAVTSRDTAVQRTSAEETVFPGLIDAINTATVIEVTLPDQAVTIRHDGEHWAVAELADFPPRFELVKQLLLSMAEMKTVEAKTANPDRHGVLGLADPSSEEGAGSRVRLLDADGQTIAALMIGNPARGARDLFYVRRDGENQTWLARGHLDVGTDAESWIDTLLMKLPIERMRQITIEHADGETVAISKAVLGDAVFELADIPADATLSSTGLLDSIARVVAVLRFDEVAAPDIIAGVGDPILRAHFQSFDGVVVNIALYQVEDASWALIEVVYDADLAVAPEPEPEPEEIAEDGEGDTDAEVPAEPEPVDFAAETADVVARTDRWAFRLPDFKVEQMSKRMSDLVKLPVEEEEEPADPLADFPLPDLPGISD